jgi:hypothetical protein
MSAERTSNVNTEHTTTHNGTEARPEPSNDALIILTDGELILKKAARKLAEMAQDKNQTRSMQYAARQALNEVRQVIAQLVVEG